MPHRVVITGFGVVSPIGTGKDSFFAGLSEGRCGIGPIRCFPADNLEVRIAGEVDDLPEEFQYSGDRKIGFALAAINEALTMAGECGFDSELLLDIGSSLEVYSVQALAGRECRITIDELLHLNADIRYPLDTAGRLLIQRYGAPKRFLNNVSACAVGVQTVGHAFGMIQRGECRRALAGGFDSMLNTLGVGGFQKLGALSANGCRPFDASRSGLVLGEGAGMVYLETLDDALKFGKTIYGEIVGYGSTLDACNLSAPDESGDGAIRAMSLTLKDAGLGPEDIDLINTHGTGTSLNDPVESSAIHKVFGDHAKNLPAVAVKSMTGHLIAAAGAMELISCIYSLLEHRAPCNIGLEKAGRGCELNHVTGKEAREWHGRTILTNSFGFGGQNGSLIIRRYEG